MISLKIIKDSDKLKIIIMLSALLVGIIAGSFTTAKMSSDDSNLLLSAIKEAESAKPLGVFLKAIRREGIGAALIYVSGLCVFGAAAAVLYLAWRGYAMGFAVGALTKIFGLAGSISALSGMFISNIIIMPALVIFCTISSKNASELSENGVKNTVRQFTVSAIIIFFILIIGCLAEGFICTSLMKCSMKLMQ